MDKEIETLTRWQDPTIEMLNKKIEAQDKIINTQALEIAHLNLQLDQALKEYDEELTRIDKAIEYIKKFDFNYLDEIYEHNLREHLENILEILGDKK